MKWPFVSRKQFDALHRANAMLREEHERLADRWEQVLDDHDHEVRKLQEELHHARQAIFNTKRMKEYEEMMLQRATLNRPHPAETVTHLMAMTDAAKADIRKATGIDEMDLGKTQPVDTDGEP